MPSSTGVMDRSGYDPSTGHPIEFRGPTRRRRRAPIAVLGLTFWITGAAVGCGGGGTAPAEQKEKQEVLQNKMKDFMQKSKLPNRPG